DDGDGRVLVTPYASTRSVISWVLGLGEHARVLGPPELKRELEERAALLVDRHRGEADVDVSEPAAAPAVVTSRRLAEDGDARGEAAIRPERFARLVTLASILIEAGREARRLSMPDVCERLQISDAEPREDVQVLNVVNFGAGSYILYAEVT